ncbi:hypothetical protein [Sphingomonas sp. S-NIH.Pt15_0812]|uniref:hypothetical protein n=1 Tax=Sphingomonas sp. S-NIH.Pt15_0812 TaxID=1920129 RepID=UPI000F7E8BD5|nr:hypothetical protein [Sphingomonas sp. S-NIH.Pt15_0812]RSU47547.1 hypothetical protein BRX43_14020 [Sphingomonas sp. S-NIH.Pt15_0812]
MPKPIDERIAAALAEGARVADVNKLIKDIQAEIAKAEAEAQRLEELSVAITTAEADADAAADAASKERRRVTRLSTKVTGLQNRVAELEESNRAKIRAARHAAAIKTRDDLVAELKDKWPKLTGEMVDLFERLQASDAECDALGGITYAEAIARNCHGNFMIPGLQSIPRLTSIKLWGLDASTSAAVTYGIWPRRSHDM